MRRALWDLAQRPSAMPSLRDSEPPISVPFFQSMRMACAPPMGRVAGMIAKPRRSSSCAVVEGKVNSTSMPKPSRRDQSDAEDVKDGIDEADALQSRSTTEI